MLCYGTTVITWYTHSLCLCILFYTERDRRDISVIPWYTIQNIAYRIVTAVISSYIENLAHVRFNIY